MVSPPLFNSRTLQDLAHANFNFNSCFQFPNSFWIKHFTKINILLFDIKNWLFNFKYDKNSPLGTITVKLDYLGTVTIDKANIHMLTKRIPKNRIKVAMLQQIKKT